MRLLALDQAARVSGVSLFKDGKLVRCLTINIKSNQELGKRLRQFTDALDELYEKDGFDEVAFEDIQLQMGNVSTFKSLAYVQAVIIYWCETHSVPYSILSPSHWRGILKEKYGITFGRKRAEQKAASLKFARERISETDEELAASLTEDMADSYCLGLAALEERGHKEGAF